MTSQKPKVAFYWCASCGGCDEAVVDLDEGLLEVAGAVDIVLWPVALDFKRKNVEELQDGAIAVSFINGAIRNSEQREWAELLRKKSQVVIAFGSCSHMGGIPGLANLSERDAILKEVYCDAASVVNPERTSPQQIFGVNGEQLELPVLLNSVSTLSQVIDVDYYLPGCPPPTKLIAAAIGALLKGELPPKGAILAPDYALCEECPRKASKPEGLAIAQFRRAHEVLINPESCLLAQGIVCMGPATRAGCEAVCIDGNMPCTGCMGPTSRVADQGAKALAAVASVVDSKEEGEIDRILSAIPDPVGTFYRYGVPASLLRRKPAPTVGRTEGTRYARTERSDLEDQDLTDQYRSHHATGRARKN
jgi:F420-non-reducing hydrogenase small subunit